MREPDKPFIIEKIKDTLVMMNIKPSSKNSLVAYNGILTAIEKKNNGAENERISKQESTS